MSNANIAEGSAAAKRLENTGVGPLNSAYKWQTAINRFVLPRPTLKQSDLSAVVDRFLCIFLKSPT